MHAAVPPHGKSAAPTPHDGVPPTLLTCCPTRRGRLEREYEVLGELGRGAFGSALKARRRADGCLVCLKALAWETMGASERRMVGHLGAESMGAAGVMHWVGR